MFTDFCVRRANVFDHSPRHGSYKSDSISNTQQQYKTPRLYNQSNCDVTRPQYEVRELDPGREHYKNCIRERLEHDIYDSSPNRIQTFDSGLTKGHSGTKEFHQLLPMEPYHHYHSKTNYHYGPCIRCHQYVIAMSREKEEEEEKNEDDTELPICSHSAVSGIDRIPKESMWSHPYSSLHSTENIPPFLSTSSPVHQDSPLCYAHHQNTRLFRDLSSTCGRYSWSHNRHHSQRPNAGPDADNDRIHRDGRSDGIRDILSLSRGTRARADDRSIGSCQHPDSPFKPVSACKYKTKSWAI